MNKKAKDYIKSNTLDLENNGRMDSTGYVHYAVSIGKAYGAILIAEEEYKQRAISAFRRQCQLQNPNCICGVTIEFWNCEKLFYFIHELEKD